MNGQINIINEGKRLLDAFKNKFKEKEYSKDRGLLCIRPYISKKSTLGFLCSLHFAAF
jgi:hypothetical protein